MGYAIARVAAYRGADVTLVSGPVDLPRPLFVETVLVERQGNVRGSNTQGAGEQDIIIKAAAVADYRPATVGRKSRNPTVIYPLPWSGLTTSWDGWGRTGGTDSSSAGFSMETQEYAGEFRAKLAKKHIDMIVANNLKVEGADSARIPMW